VCCFRRHDLCRNEIGLGNNHDGILVLPDDAKTGTPAKEYFNLQTDSTFVIGLTQTVLTAYSLWRCTRSGAYLGKTRHEGKIADTSAFKTDIQAIR